MYLLNSINISQLPIAQFFFFFFCWVLVTESIFFFLFKLTLHFCDFFKPGYIFQEPVNWISADQSDSILQWWRSWTHPNSMKTKIGSIPPCTAYWVLLETEQTSCWNLSQREWNAHGTHDSFKGSRRGWGHSRRRPQEASELDAQMAQNMPFPKASKFSEIIPFHLDLSLLHLAVSIHHWRLILIFPIVKLFRIIP